MAALVRDPHNIRLAMLGMVGGNGHPFSWSAIINGRYERSAMERNGHPGILQYLGAEPPEALGIAGARVTHVWCEDRAQAELVARAAFIERVVDRPEEVIGEVDAVVIPTDIGSEHVARARPFIEAGLPVFIDKPLTNNEDDLRQFIAWRREGRMMLSSSCMRYAREFVALRDQLGRVGTVRLITMTMMKSWERYGIHALEGVYGLLPPGGWRSVANSGDAGRDLVHIRHDSGADVILSVVKDMYGGYADLRIYGTEGSAGARFQDTFFAFKAQLVAFIDYLRTGVEPFPFEETVEQMRIIIAGIRSRTPEGQRLRVNTIVSSEDATLTAGDPADKRR